jgi:twitching motility protein PilT
MNFEQLLKFAVEQNASDIHLQAGASPQLRMGGLIRNVEGPAIDADSLQVFLESLVPKTLVSDLNSASSRGAVFSRTLEGIGRFRFCLFSHIGQPGAALRVIPAVVRPFEDWNLPAVVKDIALARGGFTLVTGIAGTGKTTTVATIVDLINTAQHAKVVTIEDPVEHLHPRKKALVSQLEIGLDTPSFEHAMTRVVRQDPDVIVIDELSDQATALLALRAAEAGRQVIAAMQATSPTHAIERVLALVGVTEQTNAMAQLSSTLEAVLTQRLALAKDGSRRPVMEVLRGGPVTAKSLGERRFTDLRNLPAGRQAGMQKLEQHIVELYQAGLISGTEALRLANDPDVVSAQIRAGRPS